MTEATGAADLEDDSETIDLEKCTKQLAQNVRRNVKFLSSQAEKNRFFAENVSLAREINFNLE